MSNLQMLEDVKKQADLIRKHLDAKKSLSIEITDAICALDFSEYAKESNFTDNEFKINFKDAKKVLVSLEDFIKYNMQYTDLALEIEDKYSDDLDDLRDLQAEITESIINNYSFLEEEK